MMRNDLSVLRPWHARPEYPESGVSTWLVFGWKRYGKGEQIVACGLSEADAKLIAAAPELLDACQNMAEDTETEPHNWFDRHSEEMNEALRKANVRGAPPPCPLCGDVVAVVDHAVKYHGEPCHPDCVADYEHIQDALSGDRQ